jgi:hypothetical protein
MNGYRLLLASLLGVMLACALDDELENADCLTNEDCWTTQECVRTPPQVMGNTPGLCRAKGSGCAQGEQLGCACAVDAAGNRTCTGTDATLIASSNDAMCICEAESGSSGM